MKPINNDKIRAARRGYYLMFLVTFGFIFGCLFATLTTANKGIEQLDKKHRYYNTIRIKQGEINLILEEIVVQLNDLRFKNRSLNERKHLQSLINEKRFAIHNEMEKLKSNLDHSFVLYEAFLNEIQQIQIKIDALKEANELVRINKVQLEKCIEKQTEQLEKTNTP